MPKSNASGNAWGRKGQRHRQGEPEGGYCPTCSGIAPPDRNLVEHVYQLDPTASSKPFNQEREGSLTCLGDLKRKLLRETSTRKVAKETAGRKVTKTAVGTSAPKASRA
ncbi:hypothetical protein LWI29_027415 [Acer saccharum]|uniref:Uncharacterized protein n=1 Tax=Acer saccharum TaxID=4024 RepID=A0AA39SP24_ACESA|nr:hypothetical protein LWI29_027415 [Acer saccharum]